MANGDSCDTESQEESSCGRSCTEAAVTDTRSVLGGGTNPDPALRPKSAHLLLELRGDGQASGFVPHTYK